MDSKNQAIKSGGKLRLFLLKISDILEQTVKKIRGAADKVQQTKSITFLECEKQNWENVRPCFVLSTGRSGTLLLNSLLTLSTQAYPVHQPRPELIRVSKRAYEEISISPEIFKEVFKSAREEVVFEVAQRDRVFIETNNRITFFAPVIPEVFPSAIFIHLVRHPADFVRSGIRRNWYSGKHDHDIGRIVPTDPAVKQKWQLWSSIEKIGWLWNETNQFIEDFTGNIASTNVLFVKAERLFADPKIAHRIYEFLHLTDFNMRAIQKQIQKPLNVQKKGSFPKYSAWTENDKQKLREVTPLSLRYGYQL